MNTSRTKKRGDARWQVNIGNISGLASGSLTWVFVHYLPRLGQLVAGIVAGGIGLVIVLISLFMFMFAVLLLVISSFTRGPILSEVKDSFVYGFAGSFDLLELVSWLFFRGPAPIFGG